MKTIFIAAAMTLFMAGGGTLWADTPDIMDCVYIESNGSPISVSQMSAVTTADWNNDGAKDLIVGSGSGNAWYYVNTGTDEAPVFSGGVALKANGTTIVVNYAGG